MTGKREYTGGSVSYYKVDVGNPISGNPGYTAECNDIIEALGMNYAEGNAFKAIWRSCAARTLGICKHGYADGLYDAEKVQFFGGRMVAIAKGKKQPAPAKPARAEELQADESKAAYKALFGETDGWIEWKGGKCPVDSATPIEARLSDGVVVAGYSAGGFHWKHEGVRHIVAYRIAKEQA